MSRKNYKTTRNKLTNQVLGGFKIEGIKNYNSKIIKKYFIESSKLTDWEKNFYNSIKNQKFNITDSQLNKLIDIQKKYKY